MLGFVNVDMDKNIYSEIPLDNSRYHKVCKKYMPVIDEVKAELAELEKGNDFLNDLIDVQ